MLEKKKNYTATPSLNNSFEKSPSKYLFQRKNIPYNRNPTVPEFNQISENIIFQSGKSHKYPSSSILPLKSIQSAHFSITPSQSPRTTPWTNRGSTASHRISTFSNKKSSIGTPRIVRKAKYALIRSNSKTEKGLFITQPQKSAEKTPNSENINNKFNSEIENFLKRLYENRDIIANDDVQRVFIQFLIPQQVLLIGKKQDLTNEKIIKTINCEDYQETQNLLKSIEKTKELTLSEKIIDGICKYALGDYQGALRHFENLELSYPKDTYILFNLSAIQIALKSYLNAIKTLNLAVRILIKKQNITLLPHAVRLRGIANFEARYFEFSFQDLIFYSTIYKNILEPDQNLIYCQLPFPNEIQEVANNRMQISIRKRQWSEIPARVLFSGNSELEKNITGFSLIKRKSKIKIHEFTPSNKKPAFRIGKIQSSLNLQNVKFSTKPLNFRGIASARQVSIKEEKTQSLQADIFPTFSQQSTLGFVKTISEKGYLKPENVSEQISTPEKEPKLRLRFVDQKDMQKAKYDYLNKQITKLRSEFETKYFAEGFKKIEEQSLKNTSFSKNALVDQIKSMGIKSLTLAHINQLKKEFYKKSENRDYDFIDKVLSVLSFFEKVEPKDKLTIFKEGTLIFQQANTIVYKEGEKGILLENIRKR